MLRVAEHWSRLLREGLESSSLETFKTHLDAFQNMEIIQVILSYILTHIE